MQPRLEKWIYWGSEWPLASTKTAKSSGLAGFGGWGLGVGTGRGKPPRAGGNRFFSFFTHLLSGFKSPHHSKPPDRSPRWFNLASLKLEHPTCWQIIIFLGVTPPKTATYKHSKAAKSAGGMETTSQATNHAGGAFEALFGPIFLQKGSS